MVRRTAVLSAVCSPARAVLLLGAYAVAACGPPAPTARTTAPVFLYVANAREGTVTRLDAANGRVAGAALPGGPHPDQLAAGLGGRLLVLSAVVGHVWLSRVAPASGIGQKWAAHPVPLETSAQPAVIASDGGRRAAVAYHVPATTESPGPRCRLALIDMLSGAVERIHDVCAAGEQVAGLSLRSHQSGATAYLALWRPPPRRAGRGPQGTGRVVALDTQTGAVAAAVSYFGSMHHLTLAPSAGGTGQRLYVVTPDATNDGDEDLTATGPSLGSWRLRGLAPATLDEESDRALPELPIRVAFAPDGNTLYALVSEGVALLAIDLVGGHQRRLATLPSPALDLAVTQDRVYVPNPYGSDVWAIDRLSGRLLQTIPVGRHPLGIALGGAQTMAGNAN